jgi:quercetin dioxygenase-like cupin family protein
MAASFEILADLASQIVIPENGTLSRTLLQDDHVKAVLFGFAAGQDLSEHTASTPAIMHFLGGEAHVGLGDERRELRGGDWVHMAPGLPHSILAKTSLTMLLILLKSAAKTE